MSQPNRRLCPGLDRRVQRVFDRLRPGVRRGRTLSDGCTVAPAHRPFRLDCTHRLSDDGSKWRELNGLFSHSELPGGVMLLGLGALTLK